jgi:alcohol dehydrogenase class IV
VCREGIRRAARSLRRGDDSDAREDMALASPFSGFGGANAGLGAVHGLAGHIGGMFPAPYGAVCGRLLPYAMEASVKSLEKRAPANRALGRYAEIAQILAGDAEPAMEDGITWVQKLCDELQVPPLSSYGISERDVVAVAEKAASASSMKGNPIELTPQEMRQILLAAL